MLWMMKMADKICESKECTGCLVCTQVCPCGSIDVFTDKMGFAYPKINEKKCIDCFMCAKYCHIISGIPRNTNKGEIYRYIGTDESRKESSSGGFLPALIDEFLKEDFFIVGVVFSDDFLETKFAITKSADIIKKMRKSKYVSAEIIDSLSKIKNMLCDNQKVFFVGLPCQVAALKKLCGNNDNLFTVDLICHGNGSPSFYRDSLKSFCKDKGKSVTKLKNVDFRPKPEKPGTHGFSLEFDDDIILVDSKEFPYYYGFNERLVLRESCYNCKYYDLGRVGDITVGDSTFTDSDLGESVVIVNTQKGEEIIKSMPKLGDFIRITEDQREKIAKRFNKKVDPKNRKKIVKAKSYDSVAKTYLSYKYVPLRYRIKRKIFKFLKKDKNV